MRRGLLRAGGALFALSAVIGAVGLPRPAVAETAYAPQSCDALFDRLERQRQINRGYACGLSGTAWRAGAAHDANKVCSAQTQRMLARLAGERAAGLEACLAERLKAGRDRAPAVSQWTARDGAQSQARPSQAQAEMRPAGTRASDENLDGSAPLGAEADAPDDPAARAESARRVRDLLARSPTPASGSPTRPASVAREFRAGLAWSYAGTIAGMHCTKWEEPSDPHDWFDNYLCAARDLGFKWSFRGPIQGRGLKCIQINEPSDPHFWHDNYFCWPRDLNVTFRFSSAGRIPGLDCLAIIEPSDPHTWRDNFLCYREDSD